MRVIVKMLLMWNSEIQIDGGKAVVTTSVLEVRNLAVLRVCVFLFTNPRNVASHCFLLARLIIDCSVQEHSVISSNTNLALYGQGLLKLTGDGDVIRSQRLLLSQFYNITVRTILFSIVLTSVPLCFSQQILF